jgi:CxxC motif-containing protein (DUF1111 family)
MRPAALAATLALVAAFAAACADAPDRAITAPAPPRTPSLDVGTDAEPDGGARPIPVPTTEADLARTALSGGATTVFISTIEAFSTAAPNLSGADIPLHAEGDEQFEAAFVPAPAATLAGLGPVFDNVSCESCHVEDGRGRPPVGTERFESLLFRASVSGRGPHGGPAPVPGFGTQLQLRAIPGITPEVTATLTYVDSVGTFADGTHYTLQVPRYRVIGQYRSLPRGVLLSPRVAPAVFGLGLLEAVPESWMRARAIANRRDGDGITGHVNDVWDEAAGRFAAGRFRWKSNQPNLTQQTAGAYNGDMGITSALFSAESCEGQYPLCGAHAPEVNAATVDAVAFYTRTLGVPARRNLQDPTARRGERVFYESGCNGCHVSTIVTGALPGVAAVSNQVIHPYTDLLVHDMGAALADGRPDFNASGSEWRTPPLWGIGLVQTVNGHTNFLHDGRARSLLEAILWHGGEARVARDRVRRLSASDRAALVAFLNSL